MAENLYVFEGIEYEKLTPVGYAPVVILRMAEKPLEEVIKRLEAYETVTRVMVSQELIAVPY